MLQLPAKRLSTQHCSTETNVVLYKDTGEQNLSTQHCSTETLAKNAFKEPESIVFPHNTVLRKHTRLQQRGRRYAHFPHNTVLRKLYIIVEFSLLSQILLSTQHCSTETRRKNDPQRVIRVEFTFHTTLFYGNCRSGFGSSSGHHPRFPHNTVLRKRG